MRVENWFKRLASPRWQVLGVTFGDAEAEGKTPVSFHVIQAIRLNTLNIFKQFRKKASIVYVFEYEIR
jgi:hypothetical protein